MQEVNTDTLPNIAQDLSRFDGRSRLRREADPTGGLGVAGLDGSLPEVRRLRARAAVRARTRALARVRSTMAAIAGILFVITMLLGIVYSSMQLGELTAEEARLEKEILELKAEETILVTQGENRLDLAEIERVATEELGMREPARDQIVYVDTSGGDYAVVRGKSSWSPIAWLRSLISAWMN